MTDALDVDARVTIESFALEVRFVAQPGITVLFGPTASGKTVTLRLVAGLETADSGTVRFGGETFDDGRAVVAAERRGIGYAPQHGALWPHRTAREHLTPFTSAKHTSELLERVGLERLGERRPAGLSGGERQRLAFARSLARSSKLLLLDEPFSALDDSARVAMGELVREHAAGGATVLFVTHDRAEATRLGGAFVVFRDGHAAVGKL
jgi:ABC-type sulfate/molybdate transport systems ATPase subunit